MFVNLPEQLNGVVHDHPWSVSVLSPSLAVLRIAQESLFETYASYAIDQSDWPTPSIAESIKDRISLLRFGQNEISVRSHPFAVEFRRNERTVLESAPSAINVSEHQPLTFKRLLTKNERIYGYGEMGDTIDRSGRKHEFWNTDEVNRSPLQMFYAQIPFSIQMSPDGKVLCGMFVDNPGRQVHDLGVSDSSIASYEMKTGDFVMWVILGDSFGEILEQWTWLTGRMGRPPLWALGNHQCRWSYHPEARVREIAQTFREKEIPCDALYLDIHYMDGYRVFTWNEKRFPVPQKLTADLGKDGFHVVSIVDPGVKCEENYELYETLDAEEDFVLRSRKGEKFQGEVWPGTVYFPDFTHPQVREIWGEFQQVALLDVGVDGIWNDMNEPSNFKDPNIPGDLVHHDFGLHRTHE